MLRLGRCRHEGAGLVVGCFALGIAWVLLTSAIACIVSITIWVKVLGSWPALLLLVSPWCLSLRPSRALPCHRRRKSACLVTSGPLRLAHCLGTTHFGRRGHCLVIVGMRVLGSSPLDFFALRIALVPPTSAYACFLLAAVGMRVPGSSPAPLPSASPWWLSPRLARASSRSPLE